MSVNFGTSVGGADVNRGTSVGGADVNAVDGLPLVIQTGLLAEWRFDDGSGTQLTDYSSNANHGELGAAGAAPTWVSTGLSFDGGDHVACPAVNTTTGALTVWAVFNTVSTSTDEWIIQAGDYAVDDISFALVLGNTGTRFRVFFTEAGDYDTAAELTDIDVDDIDFSSEDAYHAAAFTVATDGTLKMYLDGALAAPAQTIAANANSIYDSGGAIHIGAFKNSTLSAYFSGTISYITMNEIEMDSDQIAAQYAALQSILAARSITLP